MGLLDDAADSIAIPLDPATYRVRVYFQGLQNAMEGEALDDSDFYRILLWPAESTPTRVLKRFTQHLDA